MTMLRNYSADFHDVTRERKIVVIKGFCRMKKSISQNGPIESATVEQKLVINLLLTALVALVWTPKQDQTIKQS